MFIAWLVAEVLLLLHNCENLVMKKYMNLLVVPMPGKQPTNL